MDPVNGNGVSDDAIDFDPDEYLMVPITRGMRLADVALAAKRAYLAHQARDRPPIPKLLARLKISRAALYRNFDDLLTGEHVTFNWHACVKGGFKTSPWLLEANCVVCFEPFRKGNCIFVQNVETRHEIPVPAYHAACLRRVTMKAKQALREQRGHHAAVRA